ncbi:hypothetical protein OO013_09580 [Mangrovivirga sp. M17]|uniref:Uncharacterized protein n=1 Tax=Mangrovivirga halotolerans TaxID=2993936 RepID=A0ABT3RQP8_9BACT|nr:hypothetical protein [Mangrovivirga halotolerans]MCX2744116.1 hypothetical protein [Mangrovivirga halotolerans]
MDDKKNKKKCYRASCPDHDWEGMAHYEKSDAEKDLQAHKELFPDETHNGAKIISYEC